MEDSSNPFTLRVFIGGLVPPVFVGLLAVFCFSQFPTQEELDMIRAQEVAARKEKERLREAEMEFGPVPVSYEGPS